MASIEGAASASSLRTTLRGEREIRAFRRAAAGALRRLEHPKCQRLFSEFRSGSGRTLQEELDALGQTPTSFMGGVLFADGRDERPCADANILAMTQPGSRAIWICGRQFTREYERGDPGLTEAVLIHEALHALGLGENPPSSMSITTRVRARCG
ncbi:MAG TPA: hypothetical protein VKA01_03500 [Vicinamibacteria bacterium]|nr:hypothetical protein [Vicinamibacteria bacterium]